MNDNNINLRLSKLEDLYLSLSTHLEGERILRKEEDEKCKQICDIISKQLLEIKETQPNESFNKRFSTLKDQFLNLIDSKIDEKFIEKKNKIEAQYIEQRKEENLFNKKMEEEFNHYKFELNNLNKRLELLENLYNKKLKEISIKLDKIEEIGSLQNNLRIFNNDINNKIGMMNEKINDIEKEKNLDDNRLKILENKIKNISLDDKENKEKNDLELKAINNNLDFLKKDFSSFTEKYLKEMENIQNKLDNQNIIKNKEIANFERHVLDEYENFTQFLTKILNQEIDKMKSMNEFLNGDVNIIKNKNKYLEEALYKLRDELFDSQEKNYKYLVNKMNSILNLQIGGNDNYYTNNNNKTDNNNINNNAKNNRNNNKNNINKSKKSNPIEKETIIFEA